jgi:hypothetical protein
MNTPSKEVPLQPDAHELSLCHDPTYACDTYMFEPSPGEEKFGFLFAAGEIEDRQGVGSQLLDTIVTAIQQEYYRDRSRNPNTSFEMALHQANLILHDTAEQGMRGWMNNFHMAAGVLIGNTLHISVAGGGSVLLVRKSQLIDVSEGLSQTPITNALQTFSQVASGEVAAHDIVFFTAAQFNALFSVEDIVQLAQSPSASAISSQLKQLYTERHYNAPLATVTVALAPQHVSRSQKSAAPVPIARRTTPTIEPEHLKPRDPIVINRTFLQKIFFFTGRASASAWRITKERIWPAVKKGSQTGGRAVLQASQKTGRSVQSFARERQSLTLVEKIKRLPSSLMSAFAALPKTSKIFAIISLILLLALGTSVLLLQRKRAADEEIQRASELLHQARTKKDAAETALIYNNREQARGLLVEAQSLVDDLIASGLYAAESEELLASITYQNDRLQRITRATEENVRDITDVRSLITGKPPTHIFFIDNALYTFNPDNNAIVQIQVEGESSIVQQTTQGIGFIEGGVSHTADKTIIFHTSPAGIALFDTKDSSLLRQDTSFASDNPEIADIAIFGNRLYVYDNAAQNIFVHNKTLRGYSSGQPWIAAEDAPRENIRSIAVDGNIFALYKDGTIRRFFRGALAEFNQEPVEPPLTTATRIKTSEKLRNIYVLDPAEKRIVIYSKQGALVRQVVLGSAVNALTDIAIPPNQSKIYVLDGTRVLEISLEESGE